MTVTPSEIVELRSQWNALVARYLPAQEMVRSVTALRIPIDLGLHQLLSQTHRQDFEEDPDEDVTVPELGKTISLGELYGFLGLESYIGNNTGHHFGKLRELCSHTVAPVDGSSAPSFDGWTDTEILAIRDRYRRAINSLTTRMRDMNTHVKQLVRVTKPLPSAVQSRVRGFFQGSDIDLPFIYEEHHFADRWEDRDRQLPVTSAQWLAPVIGLALATQFEDGLKLIGDHTRPLPGEPETLDHYSSHTSNSIDVFSDRDDEVVTSPRF